ncbi:MAG: Lrp/AsnC family transcriptional regulator [Arenicella sp.]
MTTIDRNNDRILHELSHDGRISNADLAERVGISASTCLRRVQELEKKGVIKGYRAILDRESMGTSFVAYITVGLSDHSKASQEAFERSISLSPQVRECHNVTGSVEYILRIEVSDLTAYKHFHTEILGTLAQVNSITSYIVMDSPKDDRQ